MHVGVRDEQLAREIATLLREYANRVEAGEVMYVALTLVHNIAGAKKHGYVASDLYERIESLGLGEYFLVLGTLRDFYLQAETELINGGTTDPSEWSGVREGRTRDNTEES